MTRTTLYEFNKLWPGGPRAVRLPRRRRPRYRSRFVFHTSARAELRERLAMRRENLRPQPLGLWWTQRAMARALDAIREDCLF